MKKLILILSVCMAVASCTHKTSAVEETAMSEVRPVKKVSAPRMGAAAYLPNATAFRMSGDFSDNVAVTVGPDGELTYFPAPSDITADSAPIALGKGWWLNNQGIGPNSVFTKYTFAEYAALPETPSVTQLKEAIIPGAKVTEFIELPVKIGEAIRNIDEVKAYIKTQE